MLLFPIYFSYFSTLNGDFDETSCYEMPDLVVPFEFFESFVSNLGQKFIKANCYLAVERDANEVVLSLYRRPKMV